MGKVRKLRQKYHISLKKSKSLNNLPDCESIDEDVKVPKKDFMKSSENIFAGLNISIGDLTKSLPKDFDARSILSTKSRKELKEEEKHLKKKERQKLRRERFLNKLELTYALHNNSKTKKKSQKKFHSSLTSLLEALPPLESYSTNSSKKKKEKIKRKPRGILKAKHRIKQQTCDAKIFGKILSNKNFKANPFHTIKEYLAQKVSTEA